MDSQTEVTKSRGAIGSATDGGARFGVVSVDGSGALLGCSILAATRRPRNFQQVLTTRAALIQG